MSLSIKDCNDKLKNFQSVTLRHNLYTVQLTNVKCISWCILTDLHSHITNTKSWYQKVSSTRESCFTPCCIQSASIWCPGPEQCTFVFYHYHFSRISHSKYYSMPCLCLDSFTYHNFLIHSICFTSFLLKQIYMSTFLKIFVCINNFVVLSLKFHISWC